MQTTVHSQSRLRLAIIAGLLALAALVPATASAGMTSPTNAYFVAGGTAPVKGVSVTGYAGKNVLVSMSTSVGTLKIDGPCLATYITPAFGYTTSGSELLFSGPYECVRQVLSGLTLTTPQPAVKVTKPGIATTPVVIKGMATEYRGDLTYFAKTQHFYKYVEFTDIVVPTDLKASAVATRTGDIAKAAAEASTELGQTGYLASVTSADENAFVTEKTFGATNIWIGGRDSDEEGTWKWTGGPDNGTIFWKGCAADSPRTPGVATGYANWNPDGEPNNYYNDKSCSSPGYVPPTNPADGENCMVTNWTASYVPVQYRVGYWNDLPCATQQSATKGYIVEYGNKPVGGDFVGVDLVEKSVARQLPVTNVTKPNVLEDLFKLLFVSKKAKPMKKQPKKPATFTVTLKVKMNEAGTYSVTVKRPDGKGIPFAFQPGSKYKAASSKENTTTGERWNLIINTKKDNETVTVKPILKNADWVKPKDTKLFFRLVASKKDQENQMCMANWCQGATIPVIKG